MQSAGVSHMFILVCEARVMCAETNDLRRYRRGIVCCLVTGCNGPNYEGAPTLMEAKKYLGIDKHQTVDVRGGDASSELAPKRSSRKPKYSAITEGDKEASTSPTTEHPAGSIAPM